jgi:dTDP-4-amino-4,6-dideoxygalactose transaminase
VLASDEYDEADYIRDRGEFEAWQRGEDPVVGVPYIDLARQSDAVGPQLERAIRRVIKSGRLIGGPEVERFEAAFAAHCGADCAVGVGNGLDALSLTLRAWGIGPGDEVIVPAHTFIATALAVEAVGAELVLADVEADTGLLDAARVAAAITPRTRAVLPVHLYGHPVDMDALRAIIPERGVRILEDAAQAHGARYKGRPCGALGDAAGFSFYPTKNLGALGDGGAVTTRDPGLAAEIRRLANYGASTKYRHEVLGGNSRLDPLQAAALGVKLERLEAWNQRRRALAAMYLAGLAGVEGLGLPAVRAWAEPVWHVFAVRAPGRRAALQTFLESNGVGTNIHYPTPIHRQPCYDGRWKPGAFPVAEAQANSLLSLPLDPMHTDQEIQFVIDKVRAFFGQAR